MENNTTNSDNAEVEVNSALADVLVAEESAKDANPFKENITLDHFFQADVRICEVIAATRMKQTKFIHLIIDTGQGNRSVVTNLGSQFEPEDFMGKKLPFILNFEPKPINKQLSEAMIMATTDIESGKTILMNSIAPVGSIII